MTQGYVSIDGTQYLVPVVSCERTINTLDFYAIRTADGVLHRQMIGVYINYQVTFAKPTTVAILGTYVSLWNALSAAIAFHTCIMPDGYSFSAYIGDGAKDSIDRIWSANVFWKSLAVAFIAQSPSAVPV